MELNSDKLEEISFRVPAWKIPFYEFVGGKLNLLEFEQELYKLSELESIIGEDTYIELVSFDFTNKHLYKDIVNLILEKLLVGENEQRCQLFVLIGKYYMNDVESKTKYSRNLPEAVLSIYEGAHIDVKYRGIKNPACDVEFLSEVSHLDSRINDCRKILQSRAVIIGYAHSRHIELLMDEDGIVYFHLLIIDELYYGGKFLEALMILFLGLEYGERLCPANSGVG